MTLLEWTPRKGWSCSGAPLFAGPTRKVRREYAAPSAWLPATDIIDTKDNYIFRMEVPGFSKDEIKMEFKDNILMIKSVRDTESGDKKEVSDENVTYHRNERPKGNFTRSFKLPRNINGKKIEARLKNGILELKVPKPEEEKPKNIPINFN